MSGLQQDFESTKKRVAELAREVQVLRSLLEHDRFRLDYALAVQSGMEPVRAQLIAARKTLGFSEVFAKTKPLVTVCVATYNRSGLLLDRCVASLRKQTYSNLQIVVVGDACTDDTGKVLAQIRDSRIVFKNRSTRGPYPKPGPSRWKVAGTFAMNDALDLAEGDFICHLDDDDEALADRVELCVQNALEYKAEFLWHKFYCQQPDLTWSVLGCNRIMSGQVTTGSIFYHRFFGSVHWDVNAFRLGEPGDWNRVRRLMYLGPRTHHVEEILTRHYRENTQPNPTGNELAEEYLI